MAHQVQRQLCPARPLHQVGEGCDAAGRDMAQNGMVEMCKIILGAGPEGKALFAAVPRGKPGVRHRAQPGKGGGHIGLAQNLERIAFALCLVDRLPEVTPRTAVEGEGGQVNPRHLADFQDLQAKVQIGRQMGLRDTIEGTAPPGLVGHLAQGPDQVLRRLGVAHRIALGDIGPPGIGIGQKGVDVGRDQKGLVAAERDLRLGIGAGGQKVDHRLRDRAGMQASAARHDDGVERDRHPHHRHRQRGAQETRGVAIPGEIPPQRIAVGDMAVGEQSQPERRGQQPQQTDQPGRAEPEHRCPAHPVERAPEQAQHRQRYRQRQRLFPVQPLGQRGHQPDRQQHHRHRPGLRQPPVQPARHSDQQHARDAGGQM